jgi:opacity protein-like surface antigen
MATQKTMHQSALYYVKGGAAWIENRYSFVHDSVNSLPFFITERDSANASRWGWTVGTGFEYALSKNVSAFVEYDYLSFTDSVRFNCLSVVSDNPGPNCGNAGRTVFDMDQHINQIKLGLNLRF